MSTGLTYHPMVDAIIVPYGNDRITDTSVMLHRHAENVMDT